MVAAVQVETDAEVEVVLRALDRAGRRFCLDVERKRDLHLVQVARSALTLGRWNVIKPNDITIDAFEAVVAELRNRDISDLTMAVYGTGNLAFKIGLRSAERGARVSLHGRDDDKVARLAGVINEVVPSHTPWPVTRPAGPGLVRG